jgi:hypothetical protein
MGGGFSPVTSAWFRAFGLGAGRRSSAPSGKHD